MSWFSDLLSGSAAKIVDSVGGAIDRLNTTDAERAELENQSEALKNETKKIVASVLAETESTARTLMGSKERVMVAELNQDDPYTKRARPTVVYGGVVIAFVVTVAALFGYVLPKIPLLENFYVVWGGGMRHVCPRPVV